MSDAAKRQESARIPMGGMDKCLLCGWQGSPDEPHLCPQKPSAATTLRELIRQAWPMRNDYFGVRMMLRSLIVRARRLERGEG